MKQLTKYHKKSFYTFMIFNILVPLTNIAFAYSIKIIIDSGMSQNREALTQAILIGAIVIFIYASLNFISLRLRNKLVRQIMSRYKNKVFKSILDRDYREFSKEKSGKFISILTENMKKIEQDYLHQYFNISKNISLMIFSLVAMFIGNWFLTLLVIIASIIPMMISGFIGQKSASLQNSSMIADQKYLAKVKDILAGFLVIKSFNVKEAIGKDYKNESEKLDEIYFIKGKFDVLSNVISQLSGMIVFLVAFGGGMYLVFGGHTTIGSVTAIVQLVNFVVMPLNEIGMGMSKFREGQATLNSFEVKDVIELQTGKTKEYFDDVISFSNVDFSYPNAEEKIFNNLSLQIKKGEKIAIVGMSGSGKSTLLNLLLRFYDVTSGYISIDNQDLQAISAESLYNLMTIVQQDVYIFDDTLKANITLSQSFTEDDIKKAVQQSGLESYILENELGLQTSCGENGSNLSGGERQRLSIARALIRKTPILLLDEATSSLDNKVTTEIENSILEIQDLTVLVVTHKLNKSMLKKYNRILFMKNGVIVEDGSFDNLMDRKGEFYKLVELSV
ncbi:MULTISPECIES: ABC transporter ATP-binding protein [unclassified Streptococcus]|uniref:ABC transporter ATP-binding protein n=1 Tax=unclassified Streptococcus TaxID=2608887 RepID=UPI0008A29F42|nr:MULTISPECIES: ABC transporter ATP-binding protein [unclassified Streptococcus]HEV6150801.1 ABC transporter ATP-binding protein [Streptococcus pneumoniae]OFN96702.1 multidrug ABC transporter ATP-binding protein [Streptococcus sp. HMSC077D04]HEV6241164.1 ABC transporter ATP-binding protein [Streptococcus pneumoniae]HEV6256855.1 ABC transporter ATP-binding protein [Streptococcus pneumoniae]HEV6274779.1 ABC transporter ATP-binding protein [Streptococcus pneumoniae]